MAYGKAIIGYSAPFVGLYNNAGGVVTYTNGMRLARGVKVSTNIEKADNNEFFADNAVAESEGDKFKSGTVTFTVDGLHDAAEDFIYGLPQAEKVTLGDISTEVTNYGDDANAPYVGAGFIVQWESGGVETYQPMVLPKVKFSAHDINADTQETQKNWQTQDLEATICRDDTAKHNWLKRFKEVSTEAEAIAILEAFLGVAKAVEETNG